MSGKTYDVMWTVQTHHEISLNAQQLAAMIGVKVADLDAALGRDDLGSLRLWLPGWLGPTTTQLTDIVVQETAPQLPSAVPVGICRKCEGHA